MRAKRVGAWHRLSEKPQVWEHATGTKLLWVDDGWQVRFPSTTSVPFTSHDAEHMAAIMRTGQRVDNAEIARLAGVPSNHG